LREAVSVELSREAVERVDREGLYKDYEAWPEQAESAIKISTELEESYVDKIVYCGMGGSGCAGDILQDLSFSKPNFPPLYVVKGYHLPSFADKSTLVLAVSYSGDTEETISALKEAIKRGCKVVGFSSGGELEKLCKENSVPHVKLGRALTPRSALPYILYSTLSALKKLGYELVSESELSKTIDLMRKLRESIGVMSNLSDNEAKQIAQHLYNAYPIIYGPQEFRGVLIRFKNSLNENAKVHASVEILPEACHNDIEAWQPHTSNLRVLFAINEYNGRMRKRFETLMELVERSGTKYRSIYVREKSLFESIVRLLYPLEYATLYLAVLRGVSPAPTPNIALLKKRLSGD
jgi:glucose/mannose-6-phosphate isomerase